MSDFQPSGNVSVVRFHQILLWPIHLTGSVSPAGPAPIAAHSSQWIEIDDLFTRDCTDGDHLELHYAEFVYFHPFVQQFLFAKSGNQDPAMRVFKRLDVSAAEIRLRLPWLDTSECCLRLNVERIHLYYFRSELAILVIELSHASPISLRIAMDVLDSVRRAYAPYWSYDRKEDGSQACFGGHCPAAFEWIGLDGQRIQTASSDFADRTHVEEVRALRRPPISRHLRWLLELDEGVCTVEQLMDDRIPCVAYLAVDDPTEITDQDWIRLAFLDQSESPHSKAYAQEFMSKLPGDYFYDRFWDRASALSGGGLSTRYLCSGYALTAVGSSKPGCFFADEIRGGLAHIRHHYLKLALLAHMQHGTLLLFAKALAGAVDEFRSSQNGQKAFLRRVRELQMDFADFVAGFWFPEVTNHVQGKELFSLLQKQLGTSKHFENVTSDFQYVGAILEGIEAARLNRLSTQLTRFAHYGIFLSIAVSVLGMNVVIDSLKKPSGELIDRLCRENNWLLVPDWLKELSVFSACCVLAVLAAWIVLERTVKEK